MAIPIGRRALAEAHPRTRPFLISGLNGRRRFVSYPFAHLRTLIFEFLVPFLHRVLESTRLHCREGTLKEQVEFCLSGLVNPTVDHCPSVKIKVGTSASEAKVCLPGLA